MSTKKELEKKLDEIYNILQNYQTENQNIGVLAGVSGVSLFQFYYARYKDSEEAADKGAEIISQAVESISNGYTFPTFCSGIAGAAWVLDFLSEEEFVDIDNDELLADLDPFLLEAMNGDIERSYFDFLHGATGYGFYFLKRYQNTQSPELKERYRNNVNTLIQALWEAAQKEENGIIWWVFDLNVEEGTKGGNLSLSHGMSSIINFLSRAYLHDDFKDATSKMLDGAIRYILSHKKEDTSQSSWYPSWVHEDVPKEGSSRLAWCYGDLGIGLSMWRGGSVLDNETYKNEALAMVKNSTKRRDLKEAVVLDSGHCHGACGVANIYNHMFQETKEASFQEAADFWLDELLKMAIHKDGDAGFKQWRGDKKEWMNELNLLEGISGIGLTLISFLATFETKWDECLLIS
ncbi:lanthionine synthetase C family protein [Aquimarina spongiae]|uniref:Lanthionine synthetase C-like protein n=1 Tax=Aquimarina spongiae TaxID=570521 RepID=A0A1M6JJZ1_9FLAO|nr:lanthionine synthetase C family protein [Aquimarina spongiae]SHJ46989.1 Lanthionine synthetase C-like protein [Aquimarina spongiae]